ncbi:MAG: hypothetical protein SOV67_09565 [Bariatricus massiliensis]|nr:hypothetical protein [Bariatricus massiliensis]
MSGAVILVVGIFIVPRCLKKLTGEIYKKGHRKINFENLGPEIVKKDTKEQENGN